MFDQPLGHELLTKLLYPMEFLYVNKVLAGILNYFPQYITKAHFTNNFTSS